jgi:hypothetical protein
MVRRRKDNAFVKPLRLVALAVWITGTLLACSAARSLYQDDAVTVALIPDATELRHDHPVQLEVQQIKLLLEGVAVERSPGIVASLFYSRKREPAFQPAEIEVLAPPVQAALAQVTPTQRVLFSITRKASQVPEKTDWELWINHQLLHLFLARHHLIVDRRQAELTATLESAFTRDPGTPRDLPNDLRVLFVPEEYIVSQNPTLTAQLTGTPQTHVVIDYRGYLVDLEKRKQLPPARGTSAAAPRPGGVAMESSKAQATQSDRVEPETDAGLKERVKTLESQMNDLLGVIKQLSTQLAEVNKTLGARDEEIKALKSGRTRNSKPK